MSADLAPADEAGIAEAIAAAAAAREPLAIEGRGTKRALLRPVQAARTLSARNLTGITLYRPTELVISARAGTPLDEIEAALAEKGQALAPEPPDTRALFGVAEGATIGGVVATNLSGPRRISAGAIRDHLLGIRFVNGAGEVIHSGGRVLKNVTGLDLCKLLAGSHGTLGVLTEVTLKVLPAPEASASIGVRVADVATGVKALSAGLGSPYGVSGAALIPAFCGPDGPANHVAFLRLEDFSDSVAYRSGRLAEDLARFGDVRVLEDGESRDLWGSIRDAGPLGAAPEEAIWRISVRPSAGPGVVAAMAQAGARCLLDWGGGLVWIAGAATASRHAAVMDVATSAGGTFTLFRAPEPLRAAVAVLPEEPPALAVIGARVKAALDPAGVLNPGRMRAG
ncbi:glycolate oxidase subunit GlcE [Falsiroseomonas bella]|uniref:Glycolate oxidase subunit GlcE n=1 Tax=Falsiroseomonas bella TaxID=2184016 RepID=A0A317FAJ5_9PROT|nr:glycolate oxidase subunit GlcE [Falsiroseomonas bella]PWS35047.1 glycolate oxidase subunit GlcE [Falsiroseomonas bella]